MQHYRLVPLYNIKGKPEVGCLYIPIAAVLVQSISISYALL